MDDAALVERMRKGDESALAALFDRHKASVYRYAVHMRRGDAAASADDIVQEVFLAFLRQAGQFDAARGTVVSYLLGIARRQVFRQLDRERNSEPIDDNDAIASPADDPLQGLTRAETVERVRGAIALLPPVFREAIVLCELNEMDYASAADVLGCPIGTVRSRLHRARALADENAGLLMEKHVDSLTSALRAIANEDAARAPHALDPRVIAALRTRHPAPAPGTSTPHPAPSTPHPALGTQHPAPGTQHPAPGTSTQHSAPSTQHPFVGFTIAATLVAALSGAIWFVSSGPPPQATRAGSSPGGQRGEIATAFMPLTYSALPYTDAQIVRLEVPRSALENFGLAPADLPADASAVSHNTVLADVLVGEDGLARAVRFVRAERAPGVAP